MEEMVNFLGKIFIVWNKAINYGKATYIYIYYVSNALEKKPYTASIHFQLASL